MKAESLFSMILICITLSACGTETIEVVECENYPLRRTNPLLNSSEFGYLKFHKAATFDALRNDGQFLMADSKFDFSTSYILDISYPAGPQTITQHAEGCVASSSLNIKTPLNAEQRKILNKYEDFLISNGVDATEAGKISQALTNSSEYAQRASFRGYRLLYGLTEHPARGKFFKIDVKR